MQKKKIKTLLCLSCLLCLGLASCDSGGGSQSSSGTGEASSEEPLTPIDIDYTSVKSAVEGMAGLHNFTITTTEEYYVESNVPGVDPTLETTEYANVFTEHYTFCDYPDAETGFAEKNGEVFKIDLYDSTDDASEDKHFVHSDAYLDESGAKLTSIWDAELFSSPLLSEASVASASSETSLEITRKNDRLSYLRFLEMAETEIVNISSYVASIVTLNNGNRRLQLAMEFTDGSSATSLVSSVGTSQNVSVAQYLASIDGAESYPETLKKAAKGFLGNNFTKRTYGEVNYENDADHTLIGQEIYHSDYWYGAFYANSGQELLSRGFVSLPNKLYDDGTQQAELNGAYIFYLDSMLDNASVILTAPAFTTSISNMPEIMGYPSLQTMWEHSFQFFESTELPSNYDLEGEAYITLNPNILLDFFYNTQLEYVISSSTTIYQLMLLDLTIVVDLDEAGNLNRVDFLLGTLLNGGLLTCQLTYEDFGFASIPSLDEWLQTYITDQA